MNLKRWLVLCLVLVTVSGCTRIGDDTYNPAEINPDEAGQYVWICKEQGIYLTKGSYFPLVGEIMTGSGCDCVTAVIGTTSFTINVIQSGAYSYEKENGSLCCDDSKITCVLSSRRPNYRETYFICKNRNDKSVFNKKWTFVRCNKKDAIPSDFGFDLENRDDIADRIIIKGIGCGDFPLSELDDVKAGTKIPGSE